jgi:hypothetical protein
MIEEQRKLTFSMDELAAAVLSYLIASKKMGERDKLGRIAVNDGKDVSVSATIVAATGEQSFLDLGAQALGAMLIAHCIRRKIPLPKRASKSIARNGDRLALAFNM